MLNTIACTGSGIDQTYLFDVDFLLHRSAHRCLLPPFRSISLPILDGHGFALLADGVRRSALPLCQPLCERQIDHGPSASLFENVAIGHHHCSSSVREKIACLASTALPHFCKPFSSCSLFLSSVEFFPFELSIRNRYPSVCQKVFTMLRCKTIQGVDDGAWHCCCCTCEYCFFYCVRVSCTHIQTFSFSFSFHLKNSLNAIPHFWFDDGSTGAVLVADWTMRCGQGDHRLFSAVAVVFMLLLVVGIPFGVLLTLFSNRKHLFDQTHPLHVETRFKYGTLYSMYEQKYYWFEIVNIVYKAIMTGALCVVAPGTSTQPLVGLLIQTLYVENHCYVYCFRLSTSKLPHHFVCTQRDFFFLFPQPQVFVADLKSSTVQACLFRFCQFVCVDWVVSHHVVCFCIDIGCWKRKPRVRQRFYGRGAVGGRDFYCICRQLFCVDAVEHVQDNSWAVSLERKKGGGGEGRGSGKCGGGEQE